MHDYEKIFAERGAAYHRAMCRAPAARAAEFEAAVRLAEPKRGEYLLDAPSGGGYLERYVLAGVGRPCGWVRPDVDRWFAASPATSVALGASRNQRCGTAP